MMKGTSRTLLLVRICVLLALMLPTSALAAPSAGPLAALPGAAGPGQITQQPAAPTTNTIFLKVISARTEPKANDGAGVTKGDPVTQYKWLLSVDNTGNPDQSYQPDCYPYTDPPTNSIRNPNYPDKCDWPSMRTVPGWAPIYTQGTEADLNETKGLTLPNGKYLISVEGDGYRIDGQHFTVPMTGPGLVTVEDQPLPLPTATMRIKVFDDSAMTNGQYDAPSEQGLAGFKASINDILGEVTNDMFGNPLCTEYEKAANGDVLLDADGLPVVKTLGAGCFSDANGDITIPNLGTVRFDVSVIPPDGTNWTETTTLEGGLGWDTWLLEGSTGLDNEFVVAGEPFPWTVFGFVQPKQPNLGGTGKIIGRLMSSITASPTQGGLPYQGTNWGGYAGTVLNGPITDGWVSVNDLQNGDQAVWIGRANPDGTFEVPNVPAGNYQVTYWDNQLSYILDFVQATVQAGQTADVGIRTMTNWYTPLSGYVFHDYNGNGKMDPDEPGVPNYPVTLKYRNNATIDRMTTLVTTDPTGYYHIERAYPMGSWMVLEAYTSNYRTTGVTYQVWNQSEPTTILGDGVDLAVLPVLGQPGRLDWGVDTYEVGTNGGIVGTVTYDTMRTEDDGAYAAQDSYQPGIPGMTLKLYPAAKDPATGHFIKEADGSYKKGPLLNTATTETFERPKNCQARNVDNLPIDYPVLPPFDPTGAAPKDCLEGPVMGTQFGNDFQTLDGNYAFVDGCFNADKTPGAFDPVSGTCTTGAIASLPPGDYLVEVEIPNDSVFNRPLFQITREEDVNMFSGDSFIPSVAPPPCAGALHTVDVKGVGADGPNAVNNPAFADAGGSRFEGQQKPYCNVKLVTVGNGKSIAPIFNMFTPVEIPGRWKGYIIDDLNISSDPYELFFGEVAGVPNIPIGIYDFTGRLVTTVSSDKHGVYEVLLPSSNTTNAATPSGLLAGMYYIYGNDPGAPGKMNPNYNPQFRSIGATFEIFPGSWTPSDLAPTQNGAQIFTQQSKYNQASQCKLEDFMPQMFSIDKPYGGRGATVTIKGIGFGTSGPGANGYVALNNPALGTWRLNPVSWTDTQIVATIPNPSRNPPRYGQYQIQLYNANGYRSVNTVSYHVIGGSGSTGYNPRIFEVGVGKTYDPNNPIYDGTARGPIQHAVDDAIASNQQSLVVVYPGQAAVLTNPFGSYFENVVLYGPVKLQGVGPGGVYADGSSVPGSIIDGRAVGGDTAYTDWWRATLIPDIWFNKGGWDGSQVDADGNPILQEGAVVTVLAKNGKFTNNYHALIDGFYITGGDQQGNPANIDQTFGPTPGVNPNIVVQGGGIYVNGYAKYLEITNNLVMGNGGSYGGGIRVGVPDVAQPNTDHQNDNLVISYNRIVANGGTNLAGGIGLFAGAENYNVSYNDICGNYSAEYGGGVSHYGYSPNGKIHHNRIFYNRAYDEGGGVMIAGELPADPTKLSPGAGSVTINNNIIQGNLSNDDGGGIRFLNAENFPFNVFNNMITNNVSTHEGGGVSLSDAPNVRVYNNTIMKNITTATAMTSDGQPAPAGLSTVRNSNLLQATLPTGSPVFSNPTLFNNIFWDNRAGTRTNQGVTGIGLQGDPGPIYHWDLGTADASGTLQTANSLLQVSGVSGPNNIVGSDPLVAQSYDVTLSIFPWRGNTNFLDVSLVSMAAPLKMVGDYHINTGSPAINKGAQSWMSIAAPTDDIDSRTRNFPVDIGADELGR